MEECKRIIVIGNGAAGLNAVKSIRNSDKETPILMISKEEYRTYYRPQLSSLIVKDMQEKRFYVQSSEWYQENNIDELLGVEVKAINPNEKKVILSSKEEINYSKLILATGSYNFIPPIKAGNTILTSDNYRNFEGIYSIKDIKDALEVKEALDNAETAVVLGGGLLGLEAAWEMKQKGLNVKVIEFFPRLLPKQLDIEGSRIFEEIARDSGVDIILGDSITEIIMENSVLKGLKLQSGKEINCDILLCSVGIRCNLKLAEDAGIDINRGVVVNNRMETNIPGIYACGDCAEVNGMVYGNWMASIEMGKTAGENVAGNTSLFEDFTSSLMLNSLGAKIFSAGSMNFEDQELVQLSLRHGRQYKKLFFKDNKLQGGILIGNIGSMAKINAGIKNAMTKEEALASGIF
ncbi:MAG: NAD(P)/FAD-dependent oxidoreductase [Clostridiaceae bacterium]